MVVRVLAAVALVLAAGCQAPLRQTVGPRDVVYRHAAVASDHPVASRAGVEILRRGGNAVDAAVATSFVLSVVRPYSCGIGGGGFMVIHRPPAPERPALQIALNYRETAPGAVGRDYFQQLAARGEPSAPSRYGPHAAGVPGTVAGLLWALEHYGTLDRQTVLAPAIRAAEEGFTADANHVAAVAALRRNLAEHPSAREPASFLWERLGHQGRVEVGDRLSNPQQARALRMIARFGRRGFYEGPVAEAIVQVMRELGGPMTLEDLAGYEPVVTAPLLGTFHDLTIVSMPPPSSGGIAMQQILGILERRASDLAAAAHNEPSYVHLLAESMKHAFADRAQWLADPAFVEVPVPSLLDAAYLDARADEIDLRATRDRFAYGSVVPAPADGGTSHLCVIDPDGMAVACTETINLRFGSLVAVPGYGFALNNEMDDFTTIPGQPNAFGLRQSDRNLPEPGKRPLSSMSPTVVLENDRAVLVAGASGGPRIITGTLQAMLNCLLFDMTPAEAVDAPRFHHQWMPEVLRFEEAWEDEGVIEELTRRGHRVARIEEVGVVQLIRVTAEGIRAASDPRKGGRPAGF